MKVCPYCTAINEEKNANKCCVCGKSIVSETEYSESDLEDNSIKQYILLKQEKIKKNKILKVLIPVCKLDFNSALPSRKSTAFFTILEKYFVFFGRFTFKSFSKE